MTGRKFRYERSDFKPLPVTLAHMDIYLNFCDGWVEGTNTLHITAREDLTAVTLDARELEIRSVEWVHDVTSELVHHYDLPAAKLHITLPRPVGAGASFRIRTKAICTPNDTVLEGIYRDTTPPGAPQQYMSQCQQWGFQRILPVFDDCTAKCTMTTTLEADAAYTHLISNGNIDHTLNPDGVPVAKEGDPSRQVIRFVNDIPMAPYLFIATVGTWDVLADEVTYPTGRTVRLEYLVPPGRVADARIPMQILKDSVLWMYEDQGYEYPREVYRTICMEKSNFGGMENVGNTTIITEAALVDEYTSDRRLLYAYGVIPHEFEHNQCGSDVTMRTPFDMWLNEAFTVDVERRFMASQFHPVFMRLGDIDSMRSPIGGPLTVEEGGHLGNIVRDGFNDPDEVVDGVTYVKAAEVIRMLRLVIGDQAFRKARDLYFSRYDGGNADTDQFLACFEEASGRDLTQFKREWLYTIGYPQVEADADYDAETRRLTLSLSQSRTGEGGNFVVPVEFAAVGPDGADIPRAAGIIEMTETEQRAFIENVPAPAFVSFNRDASFYGTFRDRTATPENLATQVRRDPNEFNRVEAMRHLTDIQRIRLINDPQAGVDNLWLWTYMDIVRDRSLAAGLKSYLLQIDELALDRKYMPFYRERYAARRALLGRIAEHGLGELVSAFHDVDTYRVSDHPRDGIEERALKNALLRPIVEADTDETRSLVAEHFRCAHKITDRMSALACLNVTNHPNRAALMREAYDQWHAHLPAYQGYLSVVGGSSTRDSVFDEVAGEAARETFKDHHPGHLRSLYVPLAANNGVIWTERGIRWLTDTVISLAETNEITANRMAGCFRLVDQLADDLRPRVRAALEEMRERIDPEKAPSISGRIAAYLGAAEEA